MYPLNHVYLFSSLGCLKNYCECFEAKIICTDICRCVGCKNIDETTGSKMTSFSFVEQMPDDSLNVSEKHFKPTTSLRSKLLQAAPVLNLEVSNFTFCAMLRFDAF